MEVRRKVSRLEIPEGVTKRQRWHDDVKARIVAETFLPGARRSAMWRRVMGSWRAICRPGAVLREGLLALAHDLRACPEPGRSLGADI